MPASGRPGSRDRYTYLLSLWREGTTWRAALRPADGGPRQGFGDVEQLVAFLLRLQDQHTVTARAATGTEGGTDEHNGTGGNIDPRSTQQS
jgi:hypothetical protein